VCFQGGIRIGNGTSIKGSTSNNGGGGAVSARECRVEVDGADFIDNQDASTFGGGAVYLGQQSILEANAASFQSNTATHGPGGALSCIACSGIKLTGGTSFVNNVAKKSGGAVMAENAPSLKGMMASSLSRFEGNTAQAGDGGAVYVSSDLDGGISHWKSEGDFFSKNVAESGSGGALAMVRTRAELNANAKCTENKALLGGGGCIFWEPQLSDTNGWDELAPQHGDNSLKMSGNKAAFGHDLGTGGKNLDHSHHVLTVSAQDKSFPDLPVPGFPVLVMRDHYGTQIIRKKGLTGQLAKNVLVSASQQTESKAPSTLAGATSATLDGPQGTANFASLLLKESPNTGPYDISFETKLDVGKGLSRIVKSSRNVKVRVGKCDLEKKGINDCACPRGQVKVGNRCLCDGAAIVKQVGTFGLGQHQEATPVHYFAKDQTTYLIGYFNASNISAAGMETCPNKEDQDEFGFCCVPCLKGADCTPCATQTVQIITKEEIEEGRIMPKCADSEQKYSLEIADLTPLPGYWKANPHANEFMDCSKAFAGNNVDTGAMLAKARCCPLTATNGNLSASTCKILGSNITDPSRQCLNNTAEAYEGPACKVCRVNFAFDVGTNKCVHCDGGASIGNVFGGVFVVLALVLIGLTIWFWKADVEKEGGKKKKSCCGKKKKQSKDENSKGKESKDDVAENTIKSKKAHIEEQRKKHSGTRFLGDQALLGRIQGSSSSGVSSVSDASRNDIQVITDRIKVFYGWLQIFSSLTFTFSGIPWPDKLWSMSNWLSFVNFDPSGLFPRVAGCSLAVDYTEKLIVHLCFPVLLLVTIFIARIPAFLFKRSETQKRKQRQLTFKLITSLSLIMYPGICTRIFSGMRFIPVVGLGEVLEMDFSIDVDGAMHSKVKIITAVGIILYVVGIPFGVAMALRSNLKYLYDDSPENKVKHEACVSEFGTLYMQYEPRFWYWEIVVIIKKMMLTGAMTVIAAGTSLQIVIALLIVLINMLLVLKLAPFADEADDWLSFLTSFQMLITLLGGLLMTMDTTEAVSRTYTDPDSMGSLLVFVNSLGFIAFVISLMLLHPKVRERVDAYFEPKDEAKSDGLTKVKPDTGEKGESEDQKTTQKMGARLPASRLQQNVQQNSNIDAQGLKSLREWDCK
jgi:hypothetical protein